MSPEAPAEAGTGGRRRRATRGRADRLRMLSVVLAFCVPMAIFAAAAGAYSHITPLGQAPDEAAHAAYLALIAHALQLPGPGTPERQQPPLYYLLGAGVFKLTGGDLDAVRDLSVGLGVLAVLFTILAARVLWPRQPWLWCVAGLLMAALPQFQFISGSVSDDAIADLSAAFCTYLLVRVLRTPATIRLQVLVGIAIGVAILSKETDYVLMLLVALAALGRWWGLGHRWRTVARVAVPALLVSGWWLGRNMVVFGRPLPHFHALDNNLATIPKLNQMSQVGGWLALSFHSFIGVFGNLSSPLLVAGHSRLVFRALEALAAVLAVAILLVVKRRWPGWDARTRWLAVGLTLIPLLSFAQMVANSVLVDYQAQGRYLIVALPALALGLAFLARRLAGGASPPVVGAVTVLAIAAITVLDVSGIQTVAFHLLNTPIVPGHEVIT
ncbi:MAG TPA: glycosyltransferase family 39 protein [Verrucomicrobiae bacterium]|nr:glycosyltransferase family 39 protein [Verrucomicrobiae bacterium]